ncbi:hypothetical protein NFI96_011421 [Prochilodus magdalenae]|nr:hypothetical protein NFI96_011421 [Prochilodus magdalenae]
MYISILLLGLISLDRYLKIVRPFGKCSLQHVEVGRLMCAIVWIVMGILALPNTILSNQEPRASASGRLKCMTLKSTLGLRWHEGFNYVLVDAGVGSVTLRAFQCRYSAVLFYTTMYISILLLGLISLDRYLKIVRPFGKCSLQRVDVGRLMCAIVWIVMGILALPNTILSNQEPRASASGRLKCRTLKSTLGLRWHEGFNYLCQVVFWGTLGLMVVCYTFISRKVYESYRASRSSSGAASKRTKFKVFVVVGVFFVCFAPYHLARVPYTLSQTRNTLSHCWAEKQLYIAKETTLWLSASNICLDPLIYVFLCRVFRRKLTATLGRRPMANGGMESPTDTSTKQDTSNMVHFNKSHEVSTH